MTVTPTLVLNAGFAGRSQHDVEHHIAELARIGAPRPRATPVVYPVSDYLLRQDDHVQVQHRQTSAEAEYVLLWADGRVFVTVGSDHTDRALEAHDVASAKQACPDLVAQAAWPFDAVERRWDDLRLRCWAVSQDAERTLYQDSSLAELLPPDHWIRFLTERGEARDGTVLFSGTVPTRMSLPVYASGWAVELHDPHTGNQLALTYRISVLCPPPSPDPAVGRVSGEGRREASSAFPPSGNSTDSMSKPQSEFHLPEADWARPAGASDGVWEQLLARDPSTGDATVLQRFDPGVDTRAQGTVVHDFIEEVYIVDGALTDERLGRTFTAGMYAYRLSGMPHGPWTSPDGALMLVLRTRAGAPRPEGSG